MFILCSVSIRAYNRYQPTTPGKMVATLQYARMYVFTAYIYRPVLRLTYRIHTHIHYIVLGKLFAYCTKFLSPLSRIPVLLHRG